jgi:hypothetical protein
VSAFLLWFLGVVAFGASSSADQVAHAVAAVPEPVGALVSILIAIAGGFVGGYSAPHTSRPDLMPRPVTAPAPVALVRLANEAGDDAALTDYHLPASPQLAQPAVLAQPPIPAVVIGDVVPPGPATV